MRDLSEIRVEIDQVDGDIKALYMKRLSLAKEVAEYKMSVGKEVFDKKREEEKIQKICEDIDTEAIRIGVAGLFNRLMADSRRLQFEIMREKQDASFGFKEIEKIPGEDISVIYQGEPGAYSQAAAKKFFGEGVLIKNAETWRDAMELVKEKKADYCVLPIENSTAGSVTEIYDLLVEYDLSIVGEQVIPIEHSLLVLPGTELSDIKTVYSHPQALMQCSEFFENNPNILKEKSLNTAAAAKLIKDMGDKTKAAIAGEINAEIYGLSILKTSIQDEDNNKTRFIILAREKQYLKSAKKLSLSFGLLHEKGSLYRALEYIADNDINLSLIESRPIRKVNWEYRFFVDLEGNLSEERVQWALLGLLGVTEELRILGNY